MHIGEFFYWLTGALGVVLSAAGFGGLRLKQNAATAWQLTDPLGRFDFHFSEGQFDLIARYLEESFARSAGALLLIISLVLGAAQFLFQSLTQTSTGLRCILAPLAGISIGLTASGLALKTIRQVSVQQSAAEIERRVAVHLRERPHERQRLEQQLRAWFKGRVGRDPRIPNISAG